MWRARLVRACLVLLPLCGLFGCVGNAARDKVLTPAMVNAWPGVRADAMRGIEADREKGKAPESIGLRAERLNLFDQGMTELSK